MAPTIRMERRLMTRLTSKKTTLDRYRPLSRSTAQRLHDDLRLLLTYHSNAIEGNTLSLRETQIVLEEGITIDGHPLREYLEATNHAHAFGNGRVGRLLLNLMLMQAGYPPALLLREWRIRYIQALGSADSGNYTSLLGIIGLAVEQSLDLYLQACEATAAQEEYRTLAELAAQLAMDADYLGLLARQGRLDAIKRGSRWYATAEAVQRYQTEAARGKRERVPQRHRQRKSTNIPNAE
ncbi:hypothetical protein KSF_098230 [Reticulibacter mediterranei]|uniref:Fido domain-containing protein n=1 Tax=Reticulibacter mediterranei TaxID=2778369 RepID=A0A8J3N8Q3_9CHLR|nr:hypothetical protein [Reticulibacter mediterranei]GHO99775.1 hypothetical protein KSF_098230 [Reticulibacter mediterranei]